MKEIRFTVLVLKKKKGQFYHGCGQSCALTAHKALKSSHALLKMLGLF